MCVEPASPSVPPGKYFRRREEKFKPLCFSNPTVGLIFWAVRFLMRELDELYNQPSTCLPSLGAPLDNVIISSNLKVFALLQPQCGGLLDDGFISWFYCCLARIATFPGIPDAFWACVRLQR